MQTDSNFVVSSQRRSYGTGADPASLRLFLLGDRNLVLHASGCNPATPALWQSGSYP